MFLKDDRCPNDGDQQLATKELSTPRAVRASLLHRLVRHAWSLYRIREGGASRTTPVHEHDEPVLVRVDVDPCASGRRVVLMKGLAVAENGVNWSAAVPHSLDLICDEAWLAELVDDFGYRAPWLSAGNYCQHSVLRSLLKKLPRSVEEGDD